jgi:HK97 family phage major capsid protein
MSYAIEAKRALSELGTKAQNVLKDSSLTNAAKKIELDKLSAEAKQHQDSLALGQKASMLMAGGESSAYNGFASVTKGAATPSLDFTPEVAEQMHLALKSHGNFKTELGLKDAASSIATMGDMPPALLPGIVSRKLEPTRLLSYLPTSAMNAPAVEFITHASTTGAAATVAAGGLKPEVSFGTTKTILHPSKIAVFSRIVDETYHDFPAFAQYLTDQLTRLVIQEENNQLLNGDGTGTNVTGILNTSGILTRALGTDTALDALEQASVDLRSGSSFVEPELIILNPATFSKIRRSKDNQNRYLLNPDPSAEEARNIFGIPVLTTTTLAAGTAVVANFTEAAQVFIRQGITVEMSNSADSDFTHNQTAIRCEERLALGVARPSAIVKVTGL